MKNIKIILLFAVILHVSLVAAKAIDPDKDKPNDNSK